MSRRSPHPRPHSTASIASDSTYHSLSHVEVHSPEVRRDVGKEAERLPASYGMQRQDSGYESMTPGTPPLYSRQRSATSAASSVSQARRRPAVRRTSKSGSGSCREHDSSQLARSTACPQRYRPRDSSTIHGPGFASGQHGQLFADTTAVDIPPPHAATCAATAVCNRTPDLDIVVGSSPSGTATCPPQTTHYWTSDRTRRLEYAAIDAASSGVRGWVLRHIVPDCIIPEHHRCVRFDDDRGSVVRYRLELEGDEKPRTEGAGGSKKRKSWWFGTHTH